MNVHGAVLVQKLSGRGYVLPKYLWKSIFASLGTEASPGNVCSKLHDEHKKKVTNQPLHLPCHVI